MFGLGLDLTPDSFARVGRSPKPVFVALACQLILLPAVCFAIVVLLDLPSSLGIGMLLLAASPGGTSANLFSHLFHGDVALNITLTAINSLIAIVTLPLITGLAIAYYNRQDDVSLPVSEVIGVFVIVLVPVGIGMLVRRARPGFAAMMERPVRIASAVVLAVLVLAILIDQREDAADYLLDVGLAAVLFCVASLLTGYYVPRALGVGESQAIASSMEIGVHNGTLAIVVAVSVLDNEAISVAPAVYSLLMFPLAAIWGSMVSRRHRVGTHGQPGAAA